jgi:glycosyltransferase involved in cell wall biosynthesis
MRTVIGIGMFSYQFGGSERVAADLAKEFRARGYPVICFAFHDSNGPLRDELENAGVRCLDLNYGSVKAQPRRLVYLWKMWRMLRRERVTALHVHHHGALILCGIPARLARIPRVVMTEHGLQALIERADARKLTMFYERFATDITAVEPGQVEYFHQTLGIPLGKLHCIANGVGLTKRTRQDAQQARARLGLGDETFMFLYVGRLNPVKDLPTLLRAFAALPVRMLDRSRLCLVGDGEERVQLEALSESLAVRERVHFLGARSDVAGILPAADAFVMSSLSEGLPMALLEAMAVGVPCIATAVGGIPSLLGTEAGITVPPGDPAALSRAMARVWESDATRERLTAAAHAVVSANYAFAPIVDRYLALLGLPRVSWDRVGATAQTA